MKRVLIVAAENSAENYALQLLEEVSRQGQEVEFCGVGGDRMARAGVDIWVHSRELSVVGIVEVLSHLPRILLRMKKIFHLARERRVDAALLIDYPDFNIKLAKKLKREGIPVYYYISPTIWAWRYGRVKLLRKWVDHLFVIFPFESRIFEKERIPHTYVGHPLLSLVKVTRTREEVRHGLQLAEGVPLVALFPGSRHQEVKALLPKMVDAVERLRATRQVAAVIVRAENIETDFIERFVRERNISLVSQNERFDVMAAADVVLTTCGTSNLEIALVGAPFAAAYRVNWLSYILGKWMVRIHRYSIVNILADEEVIPEFIQMKCRPVAMARFMEKVLSDPGIARTMLDRFEEMRKPLAMQRSPSAIIWEKISVDLACQGQNADHCR